MSIPVPFGQFVPGDSALHRLEPRAKLGVMVIFVVSVFLVSTWWGLAVAAAALVGAILVSGIKARHIVRGVRPVLFVLLFTLALNAVRLDATDSIISLGRLSVSASGLQTGAYFATRIVLIVIASTLLTLTTSPVALTDALSRLLAPFERVRVPAADIAMMLSVAMRFVPTTAEEAERLVVAQTARGARFDEGGPMARAKAYVPVLVPLFVNLFRRAEDLAFAMEARAYRGVGRTRLNESRVTVRDWMTLCLTLATAVLAAIYL